MVGVQLTGVDGELDDGLATGADEAADDGETGLGEGETGQPHQDPFPAADPGSLGVCAPQPDEGLFAPCAQRSDCGASDICFMWTDESTLCSNHCNVDADCPALPGCGAAASCVRDVCALECDEDGQCPEPMSCGYLPALGVRICL